MWVGYCMYLARPAGEAHGGMQGKNIDLCRRYGTVPPEPIIIPQSPPAYSHRSGNGLQHAITAAPTTPLPTATSTTTPRFSSPSTDPYALHLLSIPLHLLSIPPHQLFIPLHPPHATNAQSPGACSIPSRIRNLVGSAATPWRADPGEHNGGDPLRSPSHRVVQTPVESLRTPVTDSCSRLL